MDWEQHQRQKVERLNQQHGALTGYDCKLCLNRGHINFCDEQTQAIACYACECSKVQESLRLIKASGLEQSIEKMKLDNFVADTDLQKSIKQKAKQWLDDIYLQRLPTWLMLCGQSGVGKTHLCTAVCGQLLQAGLQVVYLTYRDEIPKLKRNTLDDKYYNTKMSLWQSCKILYIDDLFKGKITEVDVNLMFELLDYRVRNNLRTIISTELLTNELVVVDEALGGRIIQKCGNNVVQIKKDKSRNYRLKLTLDKA
jgi:DNA replication protein DnaC